MDLMELYNQISNPIDNPQVIEKLINAYANSTKGLGGYYAQLTKTVKKEHTRGQFYREDADRFYAMLFNKWKNSIVSMTRDEFIELYKKGSYGKDFIKMREYLKSVPDVSTMDEANGIFYGSKGDKELEGALEKYSWQALGEGSGWVHVCSRYLTAKKDEYPNVEHRLYLDTESLDTYKMTTYFIEKCGEHHIPYYFKFDTAANRDDTIVIYSSTENLTKYVEILQEIKREHPDLISRAKDPPVLTGKIDGWIGYGSEPELMPDGEKTSFNAKRAKILEKSIRDVTTQWIMNHRTQHVTYKGQEMTFQDYIAFKSAEKMIEDLERRYLSYERDEIRIAQRDGKTYNPNDLVNRLGYSINDVRSPQFFQNIYGILKNRMGISLPQVCNGIYQDMDNIDINVRNNKHVTFHGYDLEKIITELAPTIYKYDSNYMVMIQTEIKKNARQSGIDTEKFCFDIRTREKMKIVGKESEAKKQEQIIQEQPVENVNTETQGEQISKSTEKKSIDMSSLNIQTLPEMINPELMKKRMKLPNGAVISATQYIQEVVYPHLPKNGVVILDNGSVLSVKQFIEECVMFECQEKYNGDFPKYIAERTRGNLGVVSIANSEENYEINPVEITEFINPTLLEKRVKLPNGAEISAMQYIQEVYAPHIPSNGMVTLKNGATISAIQYIEECLLFEGQTKYNGDISQILFNTTRDNTGIVNADPKKLQETLLELRNQTVELSNEHSDSRRR